MPDWAEVIIRTVTAVLFLFILTRLLGKRQISQLSFFEYITGITIGDLAATVSLDIESKWFLGIISLSVWVLICISIEFLEIKSKKARDLIDSSATVLIKDGKILEDNLKKEKLTNEELLQQLRKKSVFRAAEVEFALMEVSGEINIMLKKEYQPLTPSLLGVKVAPEVEPQTIILDGVIMEEPLATIGRNINWLHRELEKIGVSLDNVFLGQVDAFGGLYVDLYDDQIKVPEPQERAVLRADLKKIEADLELFSLGTQNKEAKKMYEQSSIQLKQIILDLEYLLTR
ncbi:uncharacterized membrane protein YcaP (DUF421 family) [Paenibacillus shirakamiensis]|uniref:Uncharacterized membrane protein YcaP (DUF421 family) n=1 Tax=Paenibacillus shirakamiensis TaxID=1265935 RepID=A0ABS4JH30_9BACL|nr:DUF421 domain-containing protein [Paenibacillus shirakamiensis]MBP2001034.1 uncharacterized membrane protein YcaP (DUF421 family) [Paenibacillus shirakamiensis]